MSIENRASEITGCHLKRRLGGGGLGDVWEARTRGGVPVALRVIDRTHGEAEARLEIAALDASLELNHPCLLRTLELWVEPDLVVVAMELADGTLRQRFDWCRENMGLPGIPADELVFYIREAAQALDYLHGRGKLHRDVKPDNILLVNTNAPPAHAKVGDIGLLRDMGDVAATMTTRGTPPYIAPEAWSRSTQPASDQFSLAVTYVELRQGKRPFPADDLIALLESIRAFTPDLDGLEPAERAAVKRALHKNPAERYESCVALAEALAAAVGEGAAGGPDVGRIELAGASPGRDEPRTLPAPVTLSPSSVGHLPAADSAPPRKRESQEPPPPPASPPPARASAGPAAWKATPRGQPPERRGWLSWLWSALGWPSAPARPQAATEGPGDGCHIQHKLDRVRRSGMRPPPEEPLRRQTDVSFPARVRIGKAYPLRVQIVPSEEVTPEGEVRQVPRPHPHDVGLALSEPADGRAIRVAVSVAAENFEIDGPQRGEIEAPPAGKSHPLTFLLRADRPGPGRIMVDFSQDGSPLGSVDLSPVAVAAHDAEALEAAPSTAQGELGAGGGPAPDVVLKVFELRHAGGQGSLHFVLSSAHPGLRDLPVMDGDLGVQDLRADVASWVEGQLRTAGAAAADPWAAPEAVARALADVGHRLFTQLLPEKLQTLCWVLRQRGVRSVLVLSDEPHIPWELIRPFRSDPLTGAIVEEDGCWGETFALTRWLRGRPPAAGFGLGRVFALAGAGPHGAAPATTRDLIAASTAGVAAGPATPPECLPLAGVEVEMLRPHQPPGATFVRLPARRGRLQDALTEGGFDLLHLACHGSFGGPASADSSAVQLEDGPFQAADLSPRMAAALRRDTPLIFFNACHTGRLGLSPTGLGSWGARLVQLGCGGFIGPLWPVTDRAALSFAGAFYAALGAGRPIGEAMAEARRATREAHPGDPTWLAYCCFAHPMATAAKGGR